MKITSRASMPSAEADMTPMIDMTFQLIAFFMVLINFSDAETNERIRLPSSVLAKPADAPADFPITLQLTKEGTVIYAGDEVKVSQIKVFLQREKMVLERMPKRTIADATIIIRAHAEAKAGLVQEVIKVSQETGFEKFIMRAMQSQRK